jgi:hypothetical protein
MLSGYFGGPWRSDSIWRPDLHKSPNSRKPARPISLLYVYGYSLPTMDVGEELASVKLANEQLRKDVHNVKAREKQTGKEHLQDTAQRTQQ